MHKYGKILNHNLKFDLSLQNYKKYFELGGEDLEAAYEYARVLGLKGMVDESKQYFEFIISSKPAVLQITVTQAYVDMLYSSARYKDAKKVIENFRKRGTNAPFFMEAKLQEINQMIKQSS